MCAVRSFLVGSYYMSISPIYVWGKFTFLPLTEVWDSLRTSLLVYTTIWADSTPYLKHSVNTQVLDSLSWPAYRWMPDGHLSTLWDNSSRQWVVFYPNHQSYRSRWDQFPRQLFDASPAARRPCQSSKPPWTPPPQYWVEDCRKTPTTTGGSGWTPCIGPRTLDWWEQNITVWICMLLYLLIDSNPL